MDRIQEHLHRQAEERRRRISRWPLLQHFLSTNFFQGWDFDAESPEEVVAQFASLAEPRKVTALASEIDRYLATPNEEKPTLEELGSEFIPSLAGETDDEWLSKVRTMLTA